MFSYLLAYVFVRVTNRVFFELELILGEADSIILQCHQYIAGAGRKLGQTEHG